MRLHAGKDQFKQEEELKIDQKAAPAAAADRLWIRTASAFLAAFLAAASPTTIFGSAAIASAPSAIASAPSFAAGIGGAGAISSSAMLGSPVGAQSGAVANQEREQRLAN